MRKLLTLITMAIILLSLEGCSNQVAIEETMNMQSSTDISSEKIVYDVSLDDIDKPVLGERYIVLKDNTQLYDIYYGKGYPLYLDLDSGLPGFGYPLCVIGNITELGNTVILITNYGEYTYSLVDRKENFVVEDEINFGIRDEKLYLVSDDNCSIYTLDGGPSIGV